MMIKDYSFIKVLSYPYGVNAGKTCNKKLNSIFTELFIRGKKLNISVVFISRSYYKILKENRLITTHFFIMKIPNKRELWKIAINHSADINFKDFMRIFEKCTAEKYSFLVNDITLPLDNPLEKIF